MLTVEDKICPMMSNRQKAATLLEMLWQAIGLKRVATMNACLEEMCAWWDEADEKCSIKVMAANVAWVVEKTN